MLDFSFHELSRTRYNEMLREAEEERRAHRVRQARQQSTGNPLLLYVGNWLIERGSWLKQHGEMRPGLS
ncbi:MAG: hypothetical protein R2932_22145 [Caldilineaceae bacterium]